MTHRDWLGGRQPVPLVAVYYPKSIVLGYLIAAYRPIAHHQRTVRELLADVE